MRKLFESITQRLTGSKGRPSSHSRPPHGRNRLQRIEQLEERTLLSISPNDPALMNVQEAIHRFADFGLVDDSPVGVVDLDGTGVKVGVIEANGEGAAMEDVLKSIAPNVDVDIRTATDAADLAADIGVFDGDASVDIIVIAPGVYDQPWFVDGAAALAADSTGKLIISAAGDDGVSAAYGGSINYNGTFNPITATLGQHNESYPHSFTGVNATPGDLLVFDVGAGSISATLQWNDNWASSATDFDVFLYGLNESNGWDYLTFSDTPNVGSAPIDTVSWSTAGYDQMAVQVVPIVWAGQTRVIELYVDGPVKEATVVPTGVSDDYTYDDQLFGVSARDDNDILVVGAVDADTLTDVQDYSSRGDSNIVTRTPLDGVAVDSLNVASDSDFTGTAAAAAFTGGIASLLYELDSGLTTISLDPAAIETALTSTAVPLAGVDVSAQGAGMFDALQAMYSVYVPDAPELATASDTAGESTSDRITYDLAPVFTGHVPKNSYVTLWASGAATSGATVAVGAAYANANGDYAVPVLAVIPEELFDGPYQMSVSVTSDEFSTVGYNNLSATTEILIDTIEPTVTSTSPADEDDIVAVAANVDSFFDVFFDEDMVNVDPGDLVLTGSAVTVATTVTAAYPTASEAGGPLPGRGNAWQFVVTGLVGGRLELSLAPTPDSVEDVAGNDLANYQWEVDVAADFGDAPDLGGEGYPVTIAEGGARHNPVGPMLGSARDTELDGVHSAGALEDDNTGTDDEDGIAFNTVLIADASGDRTGTVTVTASDAALLDAWIDFNQDGDWNDAGEQIFASKPVAAGSFDYDFTIPTGALDGTTYSRFRLSSAGGLSTTGAAYDGEVEDHEVTLVPEITIDDVQLAEGDGTGTTDFVFTITRSQGHEAISVDANTADGTAEDTSDYVALSETVSFAAGGALTQHVTVTVNHDDVVEDHETFTVNLSNASAGVVIADAVGDGTIQNDDSATLSIVAPTITETDIDQTVNFMVTLDAAVQDGFTLNVSGASLTADGGADYEFLVPGLQLVFAGTAGETVPLAVEIKGDEIVEDNETFTATLGGVVFTTPVQAAAITTGASATGVIQNDDSAILSISAPAITETDVDQTVTFTVSVDAAVEDGFDVAFTDLFSGTAATPADYVVETASPLAFTGTVGESHVVTVTIKGEDLVEKDETFTLQLGDVTGTTAIQDAQITTGDSALATIVNDDTAALTITGVSVLEGSSGGTTQFVFDVTLDNPVQGGFDIAYTTDDDTAFVVEDYVDNDGSLSFAGTASETHSITVDVNHDLDVEADEFFEVALGAITGLTDADLGDITVPGPATGTILNDDIDLSITPDDADKLEGHVGLTPFTFTVSRAGYTGVETTVDWTVVHLDTDDADFGGVLPSGTATLGVGEATTTITVNVSGDYDFEAGFDELFTVDLSNPSGDAELDNLSADGIIQNDDADPFNLEVSTLTDGNDGDFSPGNLSLREAIYLAGFFGPDQDLIGFDPLLLPPTGAATIALTDGEILIDSDVDILGPGRDDLVIDAQGASRAFRIQGGAIVSISELTLTGGAADFGGALRVSNADLLLTDVAVTNSSAAYGGAIFAGADAAINLYGTTLLSGNNASAGGGALYMHGVGATVDLGLHAVITGNNAGSLGGGAAIYSGAILSVSDVANVTGNTAPSFSNIFVGSGGILNNASIAVSTLLDELDTDYSANDLSLREALYLATTYSGTDDIIFADSLNLASTPGELELTQGELLIESDVNIVGPGPLQLTIDADEDDDGTGESRLFRIQGFVDVTISALTLSGGYASDYGGAFWVTNATLDLSDVLVKNSEAPYGGAMFAYTNAEVTLLDGTELADNSASRGGGVYMYGSDVTVLDATITANTAGSLGGGVAVLGDAVLNLDPAAVVSGNFAPIYPNIFREFDFEIAASDANKSEGNTGTTPFTFTVTRSDDSGGPVTVDWSVSGIDANVDDFGGAFPSGMLTFNTGESSKQITVDISGDALVESDEAFTVTLSNPSVPAQLVTPTADGTILNDDSAQFSIRQDESGNEDAPGTVTFTIDLSNPVDEATSVAVSTTDGTALVSDGDYTALVNHVVNLAAGATSATFLVDATTDNKVEGDETFTVTLGATTGGHGALTASAASQTGTILNDDSAQFSIRQDESGNEDAPGTVTFTIDLSNPVDEATSVAVSTTDGTALVSDGDYTALVNHVVNLAAGATSATFLVDATTDNKVEGDETFTVTLGATTGGHGALTASAASQTGTILNDDSAQFSIRQDESGNEDAPGTVTFTIDLSNPVDEATSVAVSTTDGTALVSDGDYTALVNHVVNLAAGATSATFLVDATTDNKVEGDETFTVTLGATTGGHGALTASAASQTGTILNDDSAQFSIRQDESGNEDAPGTVTFTIDLSNPVDEATSVAVSTTDGTALVSDGDYTALVNHVVNLAAGATSATFLVDATTDNKVEGDETFTVTLGATTGGHGALTASAASQTGTILNDDSAQFSIRQDESGNEDAPGTVTFTIDLSNPVDEATSVAVSTTDGTALVSDGDYTALVNHVVNLAAGATSATFLVDATTDNKVEGDETFTVTLGATTGGHGALTASAASQTGTILNDDSAQFSIRQDESGNEDAPGTVTFTIDLSNPVDEATSVAVSTTDGTALVSDGDYTALVNHVVNLAAGATSATFLVDATTDNKVEGDETFTVTLGATTGGHGALTASAASQTGTILNDDSAQFSIRQDESGNEDAPGTVTFTIDLSNPVDEATSVAVSTTDGTALVSDGDYTALVNHVVNLAAGATSATFLVDATTDNKVEGDETFTVTLGATTGGHGALTASAASQTGTILNDDSAQFSIRQDESGNEDAPGTVTFTIDLSNPVDEATSVAVSTTDGTALVSDGDYTALVNHVVNLAAGVVSQTFEVDATPDNVGEGDETFTVSLAAPTGGHGMVTASSVSRTGTIENDDSEFSGTSTDDTILVEAGATEHVVTINGNVMRFQAANVADIRIDGGDGDDTITIVGTDGTDDATLRVGEVNVTGAGYSVGATNVEVIAVHGGGGTDLASLYDDTSSDLFVAGSGAATMDWGGDGDDLSVDGFSKIYGYSTGGVDTATMTGTSGTDQFFAFDSYSTLGDSNSVSTATYWYNANGFAQVEAVGNGGSDLAILYDSSGDDTFTVTPAVSIGKPTMTRSTGTVDVANGFSRVYAYATTDSGAGVGDQAIVTGTSANDRFTGKETHSVLADGASASTSTYWYQANNFDRVEGNGGGGDDTAWLYDSAGDDTFTMTPAIESGNPTMTRSTGPVDVAVGFNTVYAYASTDSGTGTGDQATLAGTTANDQFFGFDAYSLISDSNSVSTSTYWYQANGFDRVEATGYGGTDVATFLDSSGNDVFTMTPTVSSGSPTMTRSTGTVDVANGFAIVYAYASADAGGVGDQATLAGTTGTDQFFGFDTYSLISDSNSVSTATYWHQANGFDRVETNGGSGNDLAHLYDSAGNDTLSVAAGTTTLTRSTGSVDAINGFERVVAYASTDAGGLGDQATLTGTTGNDQFFGYDTYSILSDSSSASTAAYWYQANGFDRVEALGGTGNDLVRLYDSSGNDTLVTGGGVSTMTRSTGSVDVANGFERIYAYASTDSGTGAGDQATLTGTAGLDQFFGFETYSALSDSNSVSTSTYWYQANGFDLVTANGGSGGNDLAQFFDTTGMDRFLAEPGLARIDFGYSSGAGFQSNITANAFDRVRAYFSGGNADAAVLSDSAGTDRFVGSGTTGLLTDDATFWINVYFNGTDDELELLSSDTGNTLDADTLDYLLTYDTDFWDEI